MLGMPFFGDQPKNAKKMARKGFGRYILWNDLSEQLLLDNLEELIRNPKSVFCSSKETLYQTSFIYHVYSIIYHGINNKPYDLSEKMLFKRPLIWKPFNSLALLADRC